MPEAVAAAPAAPSNPATATPQGAASAVPGVPGATPQPAAPALPEFIEVAGEKIPYKQFLEERKIAQSARQLQKASHDKFREAAEQQKRIQEWSTQFEADPFEATIQYFESKGQPRAQAEQSARKKFENSYKTRYIEPEMMTPEQREAAKWKQEAEVARKEKEEWQKQKQTEEEAVHSQAMRQAVQKEIIETVEASGLPKTRFIASRVNFYMQQNLKHGYEAPREMLVQQVKDEGKSIVQAYVNGLSPEDFADWLGTDGLKKFRQYEVAQYKKRGAKPGDAPDQGGQPRKSQAETKKTMSDVDNYFNQLRRSKG